MMDILTGRPNHIEDFLVTVRTGQWFSWSDSTNKIYANLIVHDGGSKPTDKNALTDYYKCKRILIMQKLKEIQIKLTQIKN